MDSSLAAMLVEILNPESNVITSPSLPVILTLNEVKGKNLAQGRLRVAILVGLEIASSHTLLAMTGRGNDKEGE